MLMEEALRDVRRVRVIEHRMNEWGVLTLAQLETLWLVSVAEGKGERITRTEVGERRRVAKSAQGEALKALTDRGLLTQRELAKHERGDRRDRPLVLTPDGRKALVEARRFVERIEA